MYSLLREFPNKSKDPARQGEIVDELTALGPVAASNIMQPLSTRFRQMHARYRMSFDVAAARAARKKESALDRAQIKTDLAALRAQQASPTDQNAAKSWPAMQRLKEAYAVDCNAVLAEDRKLAQAREELLRLGTWMDTCRGPVIEAMKAQGRDTSSIEAGDAPFEKRLALQDQGAATRALSIARRHVAILKKNEGLLDKLHEQVTLGVNDLNMMRMILGLTPLQIDLKLCDAAHDHSMDMKTRGFFSHESPVPGKRTFAQRAKLAGTTASGENIARGQSNALHVNKGWYFSPGHYTNMFRPSYTRIGFGFAGRFWTQVFG
jgi:uncharacterized protein YkwD